MSIVKVECHGCHAPYQVEERRIPPTGLKMKCPKCGTSLLVSRPGADADLPAAAPAKKPPGAPAGPPPRPAPKGPLPAPRKTAAWASEPPMEIEPEADLPAAAPAKRPPPVPARPTAAGMPKATPPRPQTGGAFGEIDLMVDLPAPSAFGEASGMDEPGSGLSADDLPAVPGRAVSAPGFGEIDGFGDVDLPIVQPGGAPGLPSAMRHQSGLPAALGHATRPRESVESFGEIDLPIPGRGSGSGFETELPSPFSGDTRPRAAIEAGFGEIDLPLTSAGDLPLTSGASLPSIGSGSALPTTVGATGLPTLTGGAALPVSTGGTALPAPSGGTALPIPAFGTALPTAAGASALPSAMAGGALPIVSATGLPTSGDMPIAMQGATSLPALGSEFDLEHDLGGAPSAPRGANPYDDTDRTAAGEALGGGPPLSTPSGDLAPRGQVGDEADLVAAPASIGRMRHAPTTDAPPAKKSNVGKIAIAALVLVAIGGGSLALVPAMGPFGANFISDQLNAGSYATALAELKTHVDAGFDEDTSAGATRGVEEAKQAQASRPRHKPTMSFTAYAALARSLRFGKRGDDEAYARQLLILAGTEITPEKQLATAADLALAGDFPHAKEAATAAMAAAPSDVDAAALAGEIELASKANGVAAWKKAVGIKATARTLFGLARAASAAGDDATAKDAAEKALKLSPTHPGAHILLGSILWTKDADEKGALLHLQKVTDDKAVRGNASDGELVQAYTWTGRIQLAKSRAGAAEKAFATALKLDPQAVEALIGNGELFYHAGRYSEGLARFEAASRADAGNALAKVGVAKSYLALERMQDAKKVLQAEQKTHPKDAAILFWLGKVEEALGNRKPAEDAYRASIAVGDKRPEVVEAYVALAHLLTTNGKSDDAAKQLAEASEKFPDLPALHRAKGEVSLAAGQFEDAKKELEAALEKEEDLGARFKLAVAERHLRNFEAASQRIDEVAAADKDYPGIALERGLLFEEQGQSEKALEMYDAALKKAPNDPDLKLRVGSTQVIAGHPELAEKMLREVLKERPSSAEVNHFLGRAILLRGGNLQEAQRFLEKAVDFDSNRAEYHLYLGWAANMIGNPGVAEREIRKALELDANLGDAYWQRGVLLQKQGQAVDALASLQTALEKRPSRYEAYATMALCYEDQLKWPEAEQAFRKAIAGNDGVPEWHYRLGKILVSHGNRAAALPELEKAVAGSSADKQAPAWAIDAEFLVAEGLRSSDRAKAIEHYNRFLQIAPTDNAYRKDAEAARDALGGKRPL